MATARSTNHDTAFGSRAARRMLVVACALALALVGLMLASTLGSRSAVAAHPDLEAVPGQVLVGLASVRMAAGAVFLGLLATLLLLARHGRRVARVAFGLGIVVGIALRLATLPTATGWQDDWHRYLWDGAVVAAGESPYRWSPQAIRVGAVEVSDRVADLAIAGESTLPRVNHPELRTIYPPLTQFWFGVAHHIGPWSVGAWRVVIGLHDLATMLLIVHLLRRLRLPLVLAAIWWTNPLVVSELHHTVQMDALVLPWVLAALALAISAWDRGRHRLATLALAAGVAVKLWPMVLVPLLVRAAIGSRTRTELLRGATVIAIFAVATLALLSPMLLAERGAVAAESGLARYAEAWQNNAAFFAVHHAMWERLLPVLGVESWASQMYARRATVVLLGVVVLALAWRPIVGPRDLCRRAMWTVAVLFLVAPTQFPWYFLWVMPLLAVGVDARGRPSWALLSYTVLLPLYHLQTVAPWTLWLQHVPVWLWLGIEVLRARREVPDGHPLPTSASGVVA